MWIPIISSHSLLGRKLFSFFHLQWLHLQFLHGRLQLSFPSLVSSQQKRYVHNGARKYSKTNKILMENGQVVEPQHPQQNKRWKPNSVLGESLGIFFLQVGCETKNTLRHIRSSCSFLSGAGFLKQRAFVCLQRFFAAPFFFPETFFQESILLL